MVYYYYYYYYSLQRGWTGMIITTYKTSYCPIYIMTTNRFQGRGPMGGIPDIGMKSRKM